jgi:hypothetical protein
MKERLVYISSIFALVAIVAFMARDCSSKNVELEIANQNIQALTDSTRMVKNELGKVQYERTVFAGDVESLKRLNGELVKEIEAQKGKTRVVTKIVTEVVFDTIFIENDVVKLDDSTFIIDFSYKKDYGESNSIGFNGRVPATIEKTNDGLSLRSSSTSISDMMLNMKIYTGIKEEGGAYRIFARSDFPGVKFDLDGAIVDPEKSFISKKQSPFSLMLGGGFGYGFTNSGTGFFPSIGLYVGINLLNF